jgi:hypothetical protein
MITLRKRLAGPRSRYMLLPALLFLGGACIAAFGGTSAGMLCFLPAGLAMAAVPPANGPGAGGA